MYSLNALLNLKYLTGVADKAEKEMLKKGCAASLSWSVQCFWLLSSTMVVSGVLFCLP